MASCDGCPVPREGKAAREYRRTLKALGGERTPEGRAFVEAKHQQFKKMLRAHNRERH
jgi:hypothetical protein